MFRSFFHLVSQTPLRNCTAKPCQNNQLANSCLQILSRYGLPLRLLSQPSSQGSPEDLSLASLRQSAKDCKSTTCLVPTHLNLSWTNLKGMILKKIVSHVWTFSNLGSGRNSWGMIDFSFEMRQSRELLSLLHKAPEMQTENTLQQDTTRFKNNDMDWTSAELNTSRTTIGQPVQHCGLLDRMFVDTMSFLQLFSRRVCWYQGKHSCCIQLQHLTCVEIVVDGIFNHCNSGNILQLSALLLL